MAQKVSVLIEDDLDGSEAAGTVRFGLDGSEYEIDLNEDHERHLRGVLSPYLGAARKVTATRPARRTRTAAAKSSVPDPAAVRDWAKSRGIDVSDRGRIPAVLAAQFERRNEVPAAAFKPAESLSDPTLTEGETVRIKPHQKDKEPATA